METTMKKSVVQSFSAIPRIEGMESSDVIFVTAMGLICGKPVAPEDREKPNDAGMIALNVACETFGETTPIGNDGFIALKDVTIISQNGTKFSFNTLTVFYDQIIAVSAGKI